MHNHFRGLLSNSWLICKISRVTEGIITSRNGKLHCYNYHGKIYPKDDPDGVLREENEEDPEFEPLAGDIYGKMLERLKEMQKSNEGKKTRTGS